MSKRTSLTPRRAHGRTASHSSARRATWRRLRAVHGVFGRAAGARAARLDLDEGEHGAAAGDDVELAAADAHVAPEEAPAVADEVAGGRGLFGGAAELLARVHGSQP